MRAGFNVEFKKVEQKKTHHWEKPYTELNYRETRKTEKQLDYPNLRSLFIPRLSHFNPRVSEKEK